MAKKKSSPQMLADALLELAQKKPVDKIKIREITKQSGLSNQTFYNYFTDKYDLMLWIHKSVGDRMMHQLETQEYSFRDLTIANLRFYAEHSVFMLNAIGNTSGADSYLVQSSENAIKVFDIYIRKKFSLKKLDDREAIHLRMFVYACSEIYAHWARHGMTIPVEEMADHIEAAIPESLKKYLL